MTPNICLWFGTGTPWQSDCGHEFTILISAIADENKISYCPFCGREIVVEDLDDPE